MSNLVKIEPIVEKLNLFFKGDKLTNLAIETGFVKRRPKKIDPRTFLVALFLRVLQGTNSLTHIAMTVGLLQGIRVSKQAVSKRIDESVVRYLESVLAYTIAQKVKTGFQLATSRFARILVHDSTTVRLPSQLASMFPGSRNQTNKDFAMVKIQAVYDILREQFCWFWMSPFTVNDQHVAGTMFEYVKSGDLVIRDLGYFVFSALSALQQRGAFFITRLRYGTVLSNPETGKRINLLKMLRKNQIFDRLVIVGTKEHLKVRLIAVPVDSTIAAERRRRLKANRDRRLNPSKEHLVLLGWNIFILNVDAETLSAQDVVTLYGLRWRIETIFKAWKSHFHLATFHYVSVLHVQLYLYALFVFVTILHSFIVAPSNNLLVQMERRPLSLLKLSRCFREQFWAIALYMFRPAVLFDQLSYHCAYEKRHDRCNHYQKLASLG